MKKFSFYVFAILLVSITACEKKATSESSTIDSSKIDTVKTVRDSSAAEIPAAQLTGKAAIVAKKWKASEFETPTVKLTGDVIDVKFEFKNDSTFNYSEDGKKAAGKWSVNEEGTSLTLEYTDNRKVVHTIKKLTDDKMVIAGKEHGMYRTITMIPAN
jgi:hypothetical protein